MSDSLTQPVHSGRVYRMVELYAHRVIDNSSCSRHVPPMNVLPGLLHANDADNSDQFKYAFIYASYTIPVCGVAKP